MCDETPSYSSTIKVFIPVIRTIDDHVDDFESLGIL